MIRNFCKMCGARLGPNADFCPNCGCRLEQETAVSGPSGTVPGGTPSENAMTNAAHADGTAAASIAPDTPSPAGPGTHAAPVEPNPSAAPAAPGLDAAAQSVQQSHLAFEVYQDAPPLNMAQADPAEIFHSFFGDAFPAPTTNSQTNAPAGAAAPAPNPHTNAPAGAAAPAPDMREDPPADIMALSPDLLTLTVDVMADRPVIEPFSVDGVPKPQRAAEPPRSAAPARPAKATAAPGAANAPISAAANISGAPSALGVAAAPNTANIPAAQPTPEAAGSPNTTNILGVPHTPDTVSAPNTANFPGAVHTAPVSPYAPYMYGQPNAGTEQQPMPQSAPQPMPQYPAPAPQMPPPYPYGPGPWGYGVPQQPDLITTGSYIGMFLIGMIPIVGIIYLIIQAAGNQWRPNRRNFARGFLAALGIAIGALYALMLVIGIVMGATGYYYY